MFCIEDGGSGEKLHSNVKYPGDNSGIKGRDVLLHVRLNNHPLWLLSSPNSSNIARLHYA